MDKTEEIKQALAKNPRKALKIINQCVNILNKCNKCYALVQLNPARPFSDYCDSCKTKLKDIKVNI